MNSKVFLALAFAMSVTGLVQAQYTLSMNDAAGGAGGSVDVTVMLDSAAGGDVQGWSYGACIDPTQVSITGVAAGATSAGFDGGGGPGFYETGIFADGWTVGLVISFIGAEVLAPGAAHELDIATLSLLGAPLTSSTVDFCGGVLGEPPVPLVVTVGGASITPDTTSATVSVLDVPSFNYIAPSVSAGAAFAINVQAEDVLGEVDLTQGFSMALACDSAMIAPTGIAPTGELAALDGGAGPGFFGDAILEGGWTVGVVYNFTGGVFIEFAGPTNLVEASYDLTGLSADNPGPTPLTWSNDLGAPPVANVVVVDGQSVPAAFTDGSVEFLGDPPFIRGDCNDDATVDIADGIWIINELFLAGPASGCAEACDSNSDGLYDASDAIYIWNYRFSGGMAPAAPFPSCDILGGDVPAVCDSYSSCP